MVVDPQETRRAQALALADELLADIELSRIPPQDIARRAYRLARLLDDTEAMDWLRFEVNGYDLVNGVFAAGGWEAALWSNRDTVEADGRHTANPSSLGQLQADIEAARLQLGAATDPSISLSSSNQYQHVKAPPGNAAERRGVRMWISKAQAIVDRIVGAIHNYVADRHYELRFGAAVETAFEVVRADVDARFAELVPEGSTKLAAAFENVASDNPEHWANAASTCRRLLKTTADTLRPPGEPVNGRAMDDGKYINRLVDWIQNHGESETRAAMVVADLEYLGKRLDAADSAGHKGAHADVERLDAARFLVGTYLLLGDVLRIALGGAPTPTPDEDSATRAEGPNQPT